MKTAFIFHGSGGNPQGNWFPRLKAKLEEKRYRVFVPQFPTPEGQSLETWFKVFKNYSEHMGRDSILIGHSLGGVFLLKLLETLAAPVNIAAFIGTPIGIQPIRNYDSDFAFAAFNFAWSNIRAKARCFIVFQSDNDPYVGLANGEKLAKELGVSLSFIPNAGHLNAESGYTKFVELWSRLQSFL